MIIEALYPEICCLYGDMANIRYLQQCIPDAEVKMTDFTAEPYFVKHDIDMLYLGSMSENTVTKVIEKLMPFRQRLEQLIREDVTVLFTGNAVSVLGEKIMCEDREFKALGLYGHYTKRFMNDRHNSMFYGEYEGIEIVGCKSQFDFYYGVTEHPFIKVAGGVGNNPEDRYEGLHDRRLYATALLGPLLILNPFFTKKLLGEMGIHSPLAFEQDAINAYTFRLQELKTEGAQLIMPC